MIQMIGTAILWTSIASYGLSGLITLMNTSSSNKRIIRKGNVIRPITENSFIENIKYGIKDYGFLILPIYNLVRSIKDVIKKDSEFDKERISKLTDRDRLVPAKKDEPAAPSTPASTPAQTNKQTATEGKKLSHEKRKNSVLGNTLDEKVKNLQDCFKAIKYFYAREKEKINIYKPVSDKIKSEYLNAKSQGGKSSSQPVDIASLTGERKIQHLTHIHEILSELSKLDESLVYCFNYVLIEIEQEVIAERKKMVTLYATQELPAPVVPGTPASKTQGTQVVHRLHI